MSVSFQTPAFKHDRRVAVVEENQLRLLRGVDSIYGWPKVHLRQGSTLEDFARPKPARNR